MLVVFSGLDCAGKSTQIGLLMDFLRDQGAAPVHLWTRGGYTPGFNALKNLARRLFRRRVVPVQGAGEARARAFRRPRVRRLWLALAIVDLAFVYGVRLRWWALRRRTVIADRYLEDTLIDFQLNFPEECVEKWILWRLLAAVTPRPDVRFMMLVPVEESLRRSRLKNEPFPNTSDELSQRTAAYQRLVSAGGWDVLDGCSPIPDLEQRIRSRVLDVAGVQGMPA
jgi:thymidylate kinase